MNEEKDYLDEVGDIDEPIILTDQDGNEQAFDFLDVVAYKGDEYVVLLPTDEDADEVVILKIEVNGDEECYAGIEDEALVQTVFELFKKQNKDIFNFED